MSQRGDRQRVHVFPVVAKLEVDMQHGLERECADHDLDEPGGDAHELGLGSFEKQLVVDLQQHFHFRRFVFEEIGHADHRDFDNVTGGALDRRIHRGADGPVAHGPDVAADFGKVAPPPEQRFGVAIVLGFMNHPILERFDGAEALEVAANEPRGVLGG